MVHRFDTHGFSDDTFFSKFLPGRSGQGPAICNLSAPWPSHGQSHLLADLSQVSGPLLSTVIDIAGVDAFAMLMVGEECQNARNDQK